MEIEHMRKELTQLLDNIIEHSNRYDDERAIPSLEIRAVLTKISKLQEGMSVLRYLLEQQEKLAKQRPKRSSKDFDLKIVVDPKEATEVLDAVVEPQVKEEEIDAPIVNFDQPSIAKLSDALTLNDRYLFANELFQKDMNGFNDLVKSIDNSLSLNEAKALLIPLSWEDDNEYAVSFNNLVERRFL